MENEEERYTLTEHGIETVYEIHALYLAGMSVEQIAAELGLEKEGVQVLYAMGNLMGVLG